MSIHPPLPLAPTAAPCVPPAEDLHDAVLRWQAHLDAGRIGNRLPADPDILANHARVAAIFGHRSPVPRG